jgi:hypothetical protein
VAHASLTSSLRFLQASSILQDGVHMQLLPAAYLHTAPIFVSKPTAVCLRDASLLFRGTFPHENIFLTNKIKHCDTSQGPGRCSVSSLRAALASTSGIVTAFRNPHVHCKLVM